MDPADRIARHVASELAKELHPRLLELTDQAIAETRCSEGLERFNIDTGDGIAIASFLVAATQFAWQAWRDLRSDRDKRTEQEDLKDLVRQEVLSEVRKPEELNEDQKDKVIGFIVEEVASVEPESQ